MRNICCECKSNTIIQNGAHHCPLFKFYLCFPFGSKRIAGVAGMVEKKKRCRHFADIALSFSVKICDILCFVDCFAGAVFCASSATDACIRINFVDIALRDCLYRTAGSASAASHTVVIDYVCHFLFGFNLLIIAPAKVRQNNRLRIAEMYNLHENKRYDADA